MCVFVCFLVGVDLLSGCSVCRPLSDCLNGTALIYYQMCFVYITLSLIIHDSPMNLQNIITNECVIESNNDNNLGTLNISFI